MLIPGFFLSLVTNPVTAGPTAALPDYPAGMKGIVGQTMLLQRDHKIGISALCCIFPRARSNSKL